MFRATSKILISPYFQFLMETKGKLQDLPVPERGRALAKVYRALDEQEKAKLVARAKEMEYCPMPPKRKRKPHVYRLFLKVYSKTHWVAGNKQMTWGSQAKTAAAAYRKYKMQLAARGEKLSWHLDESLIREL